MKLQFKKENIIFNIVMIIAILIHYLMIPYGIIKIDNILLGIFLILLMVFNIFMACNLIKKLYTLEILNKKDKVLFLLYGALIIIISLSFNLSISNLLSGIIISTNTILLFIIILYNNK